MKSVKKQVETSIFGQAYDCICNDTRHNIRSCVRVNVNEDVRKLILFQIVRNLENFIFKRDWDAIK